MLASLDQIYSQPDGVPLRFDFFRPDTTEVLPLVVLIHGGAWISGSKEDYRDVAMELADDGYATAAIDYRLAPLHTYPAAVQDVQEFVRYARIHSKSMNIDPLRIASLGNSAGGYLAAMAGLTNEGDSRVNSVVSICPLTDLTKPREQHFPVSWSFIEEYMGVPYEGNEWQYHDASPISCVSSSAAPFLLIHGEADDIVPISQSDMLATGLKDAGAQCEYHRLPNEAHSFSYEGWAHIQSLLMQFLASQSNHVHR